jgi:hypothetical protein
MTIKSEFCIERCLGFYEKKKAMEGQLFEDSKDDYNRKEYHTCIQNYFCFISSYFYITTILFLSFD